MWDYWSSFTRSLYPYRESKWFSQCPPEGEYHPIRFLISIEHFSPFASADFSLESLIFIWIFLNRFPQLKVIKRLFSASSMYSFSTPMKCWGESSYAFVIALISVSAMKFISVFVERITREWNPSPRMINSMTVNTVAPMVVAFMEIPVSWMISFVFVPRVIRNDTVNSTLSPFLLIFEFQRYTRFFFVIWIRISFKDINQWMKIANIGKLRLN